MADIRTQTNNRLDDQATIRGATLSLLGPLISEGKLPEYAKDAGSAAIDALSGNLNILGEQEKEEAYQQALTKQLNNMAVQQSQSPMLRVSPADFCRTDDEKCRIIRQ